MGKSLGNKLKGMMGYAGRIMGCLVKIVSSLCCDLNKFFIIHSD